MLWLNFSLFKLYVFLYTGAVLLLAATDSRTDTIAVNVKTPGKGMSKLCFLNYNESTF